MEGKKPPAGEFGLIAALARLFGQAPPQVVLGIGDDCAALDVGGGRYLLWTADTLMEGVHFDLFFSSLFQLQLLAESASRRLDALLPLLARKPRPKWGAHVTGDERLAASVTIFTRLRVVRADGRPKLSFTAAPESAPEGCRPWFEGSRLAGEGTRAVFGHWALMGFRREPGAVCIDSGCVYGGRLTALRLDDDTVLDEPVAADEVAAVEE